MEVESRWMNPIPIQKVQLSAFPDLPLISWFNFVKLTRIKWPPGIMPGSFAMPDTEEVEGTDGLYRKPHTRKPKVKKPSKKAAPMKPPKKGKGKDCK